MAILEALLKNPHFVFGCQCAIIGGYFYWDHKSNQALSAKQKQEDDEWNRNFEERELEREQEREQRREERDREFKKRAAERDQLLDDWKRKLKQEKAEEDRECREARYAFSKQFREIAS